MFSWYHWEPALFWRETEDRWLYGRTEVGVGRRRGKGGWSRDVLYEQKIKSKNKKKKWPSECLQGRLFLLHRKTHEKNLPCKPRITTPTMSQWLGMLAYPHGHPWSLHHRPLWGHWEKTSRWVCIPPLPIYGKMDAASSSNQKCAISAHTSAGQANDLLLRIAGVIHRHSKYASQHHTQGHCLACLKDQQHCGCRGERGEETGYYLLHESPSLPLWRF